MRGIGQALSSMAWDGYSRLCAGTVWRVIHVYVQVHIWVLWKTRKTKCILSLITSGHITPGGEYWKSVQCWLRSADFIAQLLNGVQKHFSIKVRHDCFINIPGHHCNINITCPRMIPIGLAIMHVFNQCLPCRWDKHTLTLEPYPNRSFTSPLNPTTCTHACIHVHTCT